MTSLRLAICIPVYGPHISLLPSLLQSIYRDQTRRPDLVVISASSVTSADAEYLQACSKAVDSLPFTPPHLTILQTSENQTAGQNRNKAADAAVAAGADLLSFFDADDKMHPLRCEALMKAATESPASVFVHGMELADAAAAAAWEPPVIEAADLEPIDDCENIKRELVYSPFLGQKVEMARVVFSDVKLQMAFGHCSLRTSVWTALETEARFDEAQTGFEDAAFLAALVLAGYPFACIDAPLSAYIQESVEQTKLRKMALIADPLKAGPPIS